MLQRVLQNLVLGQHVCCTSPTNIFVAQDVMFSKAKPLHGRMPSLYESVQSDQSDPIPVPPWYTKVLNINTQLICEKGPYYDNTENTCVERLNVNYSLCKNWVSVNDLHFPCQFFDFYNYLM
jgi:hypothetical protein